MISSHHLLPERKRVEQVLTKREMEIFEFIVGGKSNKKIADLLFISRRTVENHRANIMRKLHAKTATDLMKYVVGPGSIP
jgi:two-component system response regulator NreC